MSSSSDRVSGAGPRWLVHLLRGTPTPVRWSSIGRAAVALAVPMAVGLLSGHAAYGALVSTGALPSVTADASGTYRFRAQRLSGALGAAVSGFGLGLLAGGDPAWAIPLVVSVAAVSALISDAGSNASITGLQLFVFTVLGTAQTADVVPTQVAFACFAAGSVWGLVVALAGWPVRATSHERAAVAEVYLDLAAMLSAVSTDDNESALAARHQLTRSLNVAYDRLLAARSWLSGRDATYRRLLNLLGAGTPAVEAGVAVVDEGVRPPRAVIAHFTDLATAVLSDTELPRPPADGPDSPPPVAALYQALAAIDTDEERLRRRRPSPWGRFRDWVSSLRSGPLTWIAATRLTLCVALSELVRVLVPTDRSYWITLTVGLVLKPDFGSVFGRAVLRGLGTVVGVGVGAATLLLVPHTVALVPLVAVFAAGVAFSKGRNYGLLSAFVTPLILVQMALSAGQTEVALVRLQDTIVGCVLVLVFGYLLWPGSRKPVLGGRLADVAETISEYASYALRDMASERDRAEQSRRRRRAYRGLSDLRTAFQQLVVEPSAVGRQAAAWWPAIVALEQLTDAVTAVTVAIDQQAVAVPGEADVRKVRAALAQFSLAVRTRTEPPAVDLPESEALGRVRRQLEAAFDAVTGPDLRTFRSTG